MPKFSDASIEIGTGSIEFSEVDSKGKVTQTKTPLVQPKSPGLRGPRPNLQVPKEDENISYIVVSGTNALKNERVLVAGSGIKIIDEGPNKNIVVAIDDNSLVYNASIDFQRNGLLIGTRPRVNFVPGSSLAIDLFDDSINNRVNIELSAYPPTINFSVSSKGTGQDLYSSVSATELILRTIKAGSGINLEVSGDTIILSADTSLITPILTFNNNGGGAEVLQNISANKDFNFRTFVGGGIVEIVQGANTISISAPLFAQNITLSSIGGGTSLAGGVSANREIQIRSLTAGGIIDITSVGDTINISARQSPQTISALGGGTSPVVGVSGNELQFRTFTTGGIIDIFVSGNTINLSAPTPPAAKNWVHANLGNDFVIAASANAVNSIALGYGAKAFSINSIAVGTSASVSGINSIVIGNDIQLNQQDSFAIGHNGIIKLFIDQNGNASFGNLETHSTLNLYKPDAGNFLSITNSATGVSADSGILIGIPSATTDLVIVNNENSNITIERDGYERINIDTSGYINYRYGNFITNGDAEQKNIILKGITVLNGVQVWLVTPTGDELTMPENTAWMFEIDLLGKEQSGTDAAGYKFRGMTLRTSAASTINFVEIPTEEIIAESVSAFAWEGGVSADPLTGNLRVYALVSSYDGSPVNWIAYVKITEVTN